MDVRAAQATSLFAALSIFGASNAHAAAVTPLTTAPLTTAPLPTAPLTTAAEIRALSPERAEQALPVRVRGVITFAGNLIFIQDATAGIFVDAPVSTKSRYRVGQYGDLEGFTAPGLFAPQIVPRQFTVLGTMPLPSARPSTYDELSTGKLDSQRIEIEGIIRAVIPDERSDLHRTVTLKMATDDGVFPLYVADLPSDKLRAVVDASVRVRGVVGGVFNERRQMLGIKVYVGDPAEFIIEQPGRADPFAVRATPIEQLLRFQPEGTNRHRVRVQGTVTFFHPTVGLFVEDGTGGVAVHTQQNELLSVGDRIDVLGFPAMGEWTPYLEDASYRKAAAPARPLVPISITADQEVSPGAQDSRLVMLDAELVDSVHDSARVVLVLKAKNLFFDAELPLTSDDTGRTPALARGAKLRLTGVSVVRRGGERRHPTQFRLLLRTGDDIRVIEQPSWWTLRRLFWALALLTTVVLLSLFWILILRRRVRTQTATIRRQLETEAALEARYRELFENANDIVYTHDMSGRFLTVNRAGETITGYSREELLGKTIFELATPERREAIRAWLTKVAARQPTRPTFEAEVLAKDGRPVPMEISVRPLADTGAGIIIEGIARDITERRRAEAELAVAHERLVEASRRAGMAEVASGVLHSVGNVLTSLNVSANQLSEHLSRSKVPGLADAVALMKQHAADLPRFFAEDPRGRELPVYLAALADHLAGQRQEMAREVTSLGRSVDHIKQVVSMQQGYARVTGVVEEVSAESLMEDAIRINREGLDRHRVEIVREYAPTPTLLVEKHKVLQILVNLISNAKNACAQPIDSRDGARGRVVVRVGTPRGERESDRVRLVVADNGVGIAHENLIRIFEHGFTTRKDGHGFGLHSAANTAKELGAQLSVHSDGPGKGARFTLDVPVRPIDRVDDATRLTSDTAGSSDSPKPSALPSSSPTRSPV